jgi:hypothetical protein
VDLRSEFTCGHEDQRLRATRTGLHGIDDKGDPERERLAGSGRRLATDVLPCESRRNRL